MGNYAKMLPISYEKLAAYAKQNKISFAKLGRELGYSDSAISYSIRTGAMSRPMLKALMMHTGLTYEDLKPDEKPEPAQTETEPETHEAAPAINQETITTGVYRAIGSAIAQYGDNFRDTLVSAVTEAVFQGLSQGIGRYKKDLMADIRGAVFSAVYQAHQKLNGDKVGENVRSTWTKAE